MNQIYSKLISTIFFSVGAVKFIAIHSDSRYLKKDSKSFNFNIFNKIKQEILFFLRIRTFIKIELNIVELNLKVACKIF